MVKNVYCSSSQVPVILVKFERNLNFLDGFSKNTKILNFVYIRPVGAEAFHAYRLTDGRTGDEANSRYSANFAKVPKRGRLTGHICVGTAFQNTLLKER